MKSLSIDIETYGSVDLTKSGVYAYANAPDFKILLFAYAFDDEEVNINLPVNQWRCSAVQASELGLPLSLSAVAVALGLEEQKDKRGKALIDYFSKPCKPTKTNGGRTRNLPTHAPDKWEVFKEYCIQDVEVERAIKKKLAQFPICDSEQKLWTYDQRINDRGVRVDRNFVENAIKFNTEYSDRCYDEAQKITGLENPKSVVQLKAWLEEETGQKIDSLNKEKLKELIADESISLKAKRVLYLRSMMAKTSVTKYEAMERSVCDDGRIRGLLQFYGANRTGRWAGRIVQVQNLPQNHLKDIDYARECVENGDFELFEMLYGNVPQTLSELIRTALVPSEDRRFIVADFSAIEARVIAYLAGEQWRLEVFKTHGKIYEASASQMFHVPIESIHKGDPLRQKGKIAELALGYGGSVGAMVSMGALKMGIDEEELQGIVDKWRNSNPAITAFWRTVENAAIKGYPSKIRHDISFYKQSNILFIGLPSGRKIAYVKPKIEVNRFGKKAVTYMGMNQTTKTWSRLETWGGKLVENIVQAFARDCLAESIIRLEDRGFKINFHVHDEVIVDVPKGVSSAEELAAIMCEPIEWAKGLPLNADGYECNFYMKD